MGAKQVFFGRLDAVIRNATFDWSKHGTSS